MPNTSIPETLAAVSDQYLGYVETILTFRRRILTLCADLSDSAYISPGGGAIWITVTNREDLMVCMRLAPMWSKETKADEDCIRYSATIEETEFTLLARNAALPGTCRLEERDVVVAPTPGYTVKRMVVVCGPETGAQEVEASAVPIPEGAAQGDEAAVEVALMVAEDRAIDSLERMSSVQPLVAAEGVDTDTPF